jgi:hypothetical protein
MGSFPDIFARPWFRCLVSVGFRLHWDIDDVFTETDERRGRGWSDVVKQIENRCLNAKDSPRQSDPDYMTAYAQEEILQFAKAFPKKAPELGESSGLGEALIKVAKKIRPLSDPEMEEAFENLNAKALLSSQECATEWGGTHSTLRASKLKLASLDLDPRALPGGSLPLCPWTDGQTIYVPAGAGERPLLDFLGLEFYLLHEYLSHHFPVWEDGAGALSEGYLFPVARWWHTAKAEFPVTNSLVDLDWQYHWLRHPNPQSAQYWREFHSWVDWMEVRCTRPRLLWVLLEMASYNEDPAHRLQEGFLGILESITKEKELRFAWEILKAPNTNIFAVYQEVRAAIRPKMPVNIRKRLGLSG